MTNPFTDFAETQIASPVKARMRAAQKRAMRKALAERDDLHHLWRLWRHERVAALLAGSYGADAHALVEFLDHATLASDFVEMVRRGPWLGADSDTDTRFEVLALIDAAIIALREKAKLEPFDDPIGDAPLDAFLQVRELLRDGRYPDGRHDDFQSGSPRRREDEKEQ
jgi:hypothetical protein